MSALSDRVSEAAEPLAGSPDDYDSLLATISTRGSPISSTPCSTSITRAPWNLWNAPPNGSWAKWKRRFRADFDPSAMCDS